MKPRGLSIAILGVKMWITLMFNIHIIAVGKFKEKYWGEACAEYLKRLKPYAKITLTELTEEPFRGQADYVRSKQKEAEKILKLLRVGEIVVALHETGKEYTSIELAHFLATNSERGQSLIMIIGGPLGLDTSILQRANFQLSLSRLTLTHQMIRPLLLEQIYRAATIIQGKQYHY